MSKLKCHECGAIFEEEDAEERHECVSEFWGSPAYEDILICPECGSDELDDYDEPIEDEESEDEE